MRAPFNWGDSLHPVCVPKLLSVGDQFFTTNLGFYYEVTSLSRWNNDSLEATSLPSIPYLNNTLEGCRTDHIQISLRKADQGIPPTWWISWSGSESITWAHCTIASESGPANVTVQVKYSGEGDENYDFVIEDNHKTHASTWWGTRLLYAYWMGVLSTISQAEYTEDDYYTKASFDYYWNQTDTKR